jgi:two-component system cell cycle sensor histidine kinase/response regulator CckA
VLLDLTVRGGRGGAAALSRLKEIGSGVRAIATSGYSNSPILADHKAHGFVGRLKKSVLTDELKALLVDVIPGASVAD